MKHFPERVIPAQELTQCVICRRYFTPNRIRAHEAICEVSSNITRKCFDITEQILRGADTVITREDSEEDECRKTRRSGLNTNWRGKHEEFLQKIKEAKQQVTDKSLTNCDVNHSSLLDNDVECVQCQYCLRQYSKLSASRHIPICAWRSAKANT